MNESIILRLELLELREREAATREARVLQTVKEVERFIEPYKHDPKQILAMVDKINERIFILDILKREIDKQLDSLSKKMKKLDGFSRKLTTTRKEIQKLEVLLRESE